MRPGPFPMRLRLWNVLDIDSRHARLLSSLPFVDASRVGCFGWSMGAHRAGLLRTKFFDGPHHCGLREQDTILDYFGSLWER